MSFYKGNFRPVYFTVVNAGDGFSNIAVINTNVGSDAGPNLIYLVFLGFSTRNSSQILARVIPIISACFLATRLSASAGR